MKSVQPPFQNLSELVNSVRAKVLRSFLDGSAHEVNDIAAEIGVSRQTVMKALDFFIRKKLIVITGKGSSGAAGGKKPVLYALSPSQYLVCVTLWPDTLRINLFNMNGERIDQVALDILIPDNPVTAMENVGQLATVLLQKNGIALKDVRGVSVSVPGTVDRKTNMLIYGAPIAQWGSNIPLADYLKPYFTEDTLILIAAMSKMHSSVYIVNDEYATRRLMVISASRGVTGCLIENGHILNGTNSMIGEIGHMIVDPNDEEVCNCGSRGCLEVMISIDRLKKIIHRENANFPASPLSDPENELTYNRIFEASRAGDALGQYCSRYLARQFASALHNTSLVYDPDYVIFAEKGFVGDDVFVRELYDSLSLFRYYPTYQKPFRIVFDECDLVERDAEGSMLSLRWHVLFDVKHFYEFPIEQA